LSRKGRLLLLFFVGQIEGRKERNFFSLNEKNFHARSSVKLEEFLRSRCERKQLKL
jgi:hypothetical protein